MITASVLDDPLVTVTQVMEKSQASRFGHNRKQNSTDKERICHAERAVFLLFALTKSGGVNVV